MSTDSSGLVAATVAALEQLPAAERALAAAGLIAAVQGEGDRRIARIRWAAIAEMHEGGMSGEDIARKLATSPGAIDLALQSHRRFNAAPASS